MSKTTSMIIMSAIFTIGLIVIIAAPYMAYDMSQVFEIRDTLIICFIIVGIILDVFSGGFIVFNAYKKQ